MVTSRDACQVVLTAAVGVNHQAIGWEVGLTQRLYDLGLVVPGWTPKAGSRGLYYHRLWWLMILVRLEYVRLQLFWSLRAIQYTVKGRHTASLLCSFGHLISHEIPSASYGLRDLRLLLVTCSSFMDIGASTSQRLLISINNPVNLNFTVDANYVSWFHNYLLILRSLTLPG